jgi:PKD domain
MDTRREVRQIWKHFDQYHFTIGEALIYYRFDAENSTYDRVYDEAYRQYKRGVRIPILWVDQQEATEDYTPEGRRPTQRLRCAVSARNMYEAGFPVTESHGNRLEDTSPSDIWRQDRMHDIAYYDGRYYEISGYQIRGRAMGEDVIIGITAIETFPADDMIFDYPPGGIPLTIIVTPGDSFGAFNFGTTDVPGHTTHWDFGDGEGGVSDSEDTIDHTYEDEGDYTVVAVCHHTTCQTDVTVEPIGTTTYGTGPYGSGPYGGSESH